MCKTGETIIKDNVKNDRILRSQVPKVANKRDLSKIVEMLNKKQEEDMESNSLNESKIESTISGVSNNQHIYLEPIDTNRSAVYQTVKPPGTIVDTTDLMKEQVRIMCVNYLKFNLYKMVVFRKEHSAIERIVNVNAPIYYYVNVFICIIFMHVLNCIKIIILFLWLSASRVTRHDGS